jgi:hypothetical protein
VPSLPGALVRGSLPGALVRGALEGWVPDPTRGDGGGGLQGGISVTLVGLEDGVCGMQHGC